MASLSRDGISREQNPEARRVNQYIGALVASLGGFTLGVSLGWNSSAGNVLRNVLSADVTAVSLAGVLLNGGGCIGVLSIPWILRLVSPTSAMLATIPINLIGWACICFADRQVWLLMLGRILCGTVGGIFSIVTPIYIAEIAEKNLRSRLLTFFQLFINLGVAYAFAVAYAIDEQETVWRYSLACGLASAPIALVNFLPESPLYYASNGDMNAAKQSMMWYRGKDYKYQRELDEFETLASLGKRKLGFKLGLKVLKNGKVLRALVVCHGVLMAHQLTGINAMIFYALLIFNQGGSGNLSGEEQTLVVGGVQVLSSLLCTLSIARIGRRVCSAVSATFTGLFLILLGWYSSVRDDDPELWDDTFGWMPPTWISLFFVAFNFGIGPIAWSLLADTFPIEIRLTAAISAAFLNWLLSFVATSTFGEIAIALGVPKTMWLFGAFSWLSAVFCAILVRDNGKKSLLDVHKDFGTDLGLSPESTRATELT